MSNLKIVQRRTRPNYLYALLSVTLILFVLGFVGLAIQSAGELVQRYKEQVNIIVELKRGASLPQIDSLQQMLIAHPAIIDSSVQYISEEEALMLMQESFGDDFQELDLPNPYKPLFTFHVSSNHLQGDSLQMLEAKLTEWPGIALVAYQENVIEKIGQNIQKLSYWALGLSLFFFIVAVTLVHNTIRLALYANRQLIKTMQLVGASWGFISRPYLWRSIGHGLLAGLLAVGTLAATLWLIGNRYPTVISSQVLRESLLSLWPLLPLGVLLYGGSTYRVVRRQLRMRVDDLY